MSTKLLKLAVIALLFAVAGCDKPSDPAGDPVVEFRSAEFFTREADGVATITVVRTGGNNEAASVGYSTNADTATPGSDFESQTGVLVWEQGDSTEKTFDITILADTNLERRENVVLSLGSADGVEIGVLSKATLTILDSECAGELTDNVISERSLTQGCYLVTNDIFIQQGGTLRLEPGVTLIFEAGTKLEVDEGGTLIAVGTADQQIVMTAAQPEPGYWNGLSIFGSDSSQNQLSQVKIEYAGAGANGAALSVLGNSTSDARVKINDAVFVNSGGYGFIFSDTANIDNFTGITSTANALGAGRMPMNLIPILDIFSSTFAGNKHDYLELSAGTLEDDQFWPALNVPYAMASGDHTILSNLTIADGVILAFAANAKMVIEDTGVLVAAGTTENRVIFTGLEATPGYWAGLEFAGSSSNTASQLSLCTIEYAGGGGSPGNINLTGRTGLSLVNVNSSNIRSSQGYGIWVNPTDAFVQESGNFYENNQAGDINS